MENRVVVIDEDLFKEKSKEILSELVDADFSPLTVALVASVLAKLTVKLFYPEEKEERPKGAKQNDSDD